MKNCIREFIVTIARTIYSINVKQGTDNQVIEMKLPWFLPALQNTKKMDA